MMFMGSSGTGKTETAKLVARYMFDDSATGQSGKGAALSSLLQLAHEKEVGREMHFKTPQLGAKHLKVSKRGKEEEAQATAPWLQCFIRMDMSEYQHKHEVSKFIGAPPGYVGYSEGGQLVSRLADCPNGIVLLDEVEKAHPDVLTVMLQAFSDGRITDGKGDTVDCKDATFIMTSNLAQREIADEAVLLRENVLRTGKKASAVDGLTKKFNHEVVQPILRKHFGRDEFLGRINEILFFVPFTFEEQQLLAERELRKWNEKSLERHRVELKWSPAVLEAVAKGYDMRYGARSIKYEIDRSCIAAVAKAHEKGIVTRGASVYMDIDPTQVAEQKKHLAGGRHIPIKLDVKHFVIPDESNMAEESQ